MPPDVRKVSDLPKRSAYADYLQWTCGLIHTALQRGDAASGGNGNRL